MRLSLPPIRINLVDLSDPIALFERDLVILSCVITAHRQPSRTQGSLLTRKGRSVSPRSPPLPSLDQLLPHQAGQAERVAQAEQPLKQIPLGSRLLPSSRNSWLGRDRIVRRCWCRTTILHVHNPIS